MYGTVQTEIQALCQNLPLGVTRLCDGNRIWVSIPAHLCAAKRWRKVASCQIVVLDNNSLSSLTVWFLTDELRPIVTQSILIIYLFGLYIILLYKI